MTSPSQVLKSGIGPKLVPFFKTVAIYFVVLLPAEQPSLFAAVVKSLPVVSLIAFVLLNGMSFGDEYFYSRRILLGLICSVVGDVLLVWDHLFLHGLGAFLVAQICYTSAFGFKPLNLQAATVIYTATAGGLAVLLPCAEGALRIGILVYTIVLMTMVSWVLGLTTLRTLPYETFKVWRAVSRVQLFQELWTWTKLCSCAGGLLFAFSDACIGFHQFFMPIPHGQVLIMVTYYAAQLCMSLSVVDCKASYLDSLRSKRTVSPDTSAVTTCDVTPDEGVSDNDSGTLLFRPEAIPSAACSAEVSTGASSCLLPEDGHHRSDVVEESTLSIKKRVIGVMGSHPARSTTTAAKAVSSSIVNSVSVNHTNKVCPSSTFTKQQSFMPEAAYSAKDVSSTLTSSAVPLVSRQRMP